MFDGGVMSLTCIDIVDSDKIDKIMLRIKDFDADVSSDDDPPLTKEELLALRTSVVFCHCGDCPLDLDKLLVADNYTLIHDVLGIDQNIDRQTLKLRNHFHPRCASKQ